MSYEVGDTITYRTLGGPLTIVVTEKEIRWDRPTFTGQCVHSVAGLYEIGQEVWGYDSQIITVAS